MRRSTADGGSELVEATWLEAFEAVAEGLGAIQSADGPNSVAIYLGNPNAHGHHGIIFNRPLVKALGTRNVFTASTVDQMPKHVSSGLMFGNPLTIAVPDLDRTQHLLMLGANPYESNGSLCTAPDFPGRLQAIIERGGKVVVVDPRRTKTAEHASEHIAIRPGTDALLMLAIANVLADEDLVDPGHCADAPGGARAGSDARSTLLARLGHRCDRHRSRHDPSYGARVGGCGQRSGVRPHRNAHRRVRHHRIVGHGPAQRADRQPRPRRGGHVALAGPPGSANRSRAVAATASAAGPAVSASTPRPTASFRSRFSLRRSPRPGPERVRALITVGGNPARSTPHSDRLVAALDELDFMVSVDPALNETTCHADVVLPPPSPLERSHYDLAFYALSVRNVANWSPPLYEPEGPEEVEILARLALIAMGLGTDADPQSAYDLVIDTVISQAISRPGSAVADRDPTELREMLFGDNPADQALDVMLRTGRHGDQFGAVPDGLTLARLADNPHGIDFGPLEQQLPEIISTATGRVELAPAEIVADLDRLAATMERAHPEILLVGRRDLRSNNSWMHNIEVLVKGRERCTLQVNPSDADRLGLSHGNGARITSAVGALTAPVEVTDEVMAGVVSLPHGWGHDAPDTRMEIASRRPGVNSNVLTDPAVLDRLSGNAVLNAIPVTVEPA